MAGEIYSTNMSLPIPQPGVTEGPQYAIDLNTCLDLIDQHNHTTGYGVLIPVAGMDINGDLSFQENNATSMRSVRFVAQDSALTDGQDIGCVYVAGVDLYYNDEDGNQIQITQNGGVAGTPGSISNLTSPASAAYVAVDSTFVWQSDTDTAANMDGGSVILRNITANSFGLTLNPPNAMAADYDITLPTLPNAQKILTMDAAGNMAASWVNDASTIVVNTNILSVASSAIIDNVTIGQSSNLLYWKNGYITYEFSLNGNYAHFTLPATQLDGLRFFNFNAAIVNVWAWIGTPGSSGTTTLDIKTATSPGGSFASILSTKFSFTSAAAASSYVDINGVVSAGTGVTRGVLTSVNIAAGTAMRFDITASQAGAVNGCGIVVQFKQRN